MARADVDYHREKYALVALAEHLVSVEGWSKVLLSVVPESIDVPDGPIGLVPPVIDAEQDRLDPRYPYVFYTDLGGRIDLVAVRPGRSLLVEAKGRSAPVPAGIEQLIGRTILAMDPARHDRAHAILIPDLPAWLAAISRATYPVLGSIGVYAVSIRGDIRRVTWGSHDSPEAVGADLTDTGAG